MNFIFSEKSDVTVVITSCGRFDLLKETINSFVDQNTYPIRKIIITEDSGSEEVYKCIPEPIKENTTVLINKEKKGQIKSIDLAYSKIKTEFVFHCEDDWFFYRPGFIEDSINVLKSDIKILQVWLRSFQHDIAIHSPYHYLGKRRNCDSVHFYRVQSEKAEWQGFSFNPGLRRLSDYQAISSYESFPSEKALSVHYASLGYYAVILENDAVLHTGFDQHVEDPREKAKNQKKKLRSALRQIVLAGIAFVIGYSMP